MLCIVHIVIFGQMGGGNECVGESASRDLPPGRTIVSMSPAEANLSSSFSLEAEEARETPAPAPRISPGTTSSLRCTVNEFFPRLPKPNLRFRPVDNFIIHRYKSFTSIVPTLSHTVFNKLNAKRSDRRVG